MENISVAQSTPLLANNSDQVKITPLTSITGSGAIGSSATANGTKARAHLRAALGTAPGGKARNLLQGVILKREQTLERRESRLVNKWEREPDWVIRAPKAAYMAATDFWNLARTSAITITDTPYENGRSFGAPVTLYTRSGGQETFLPLDSFPREEVATSSMEYAGVDTLWILSASSIQFDDNPASGLAPRQSSDSARICLRKYHLELERRSTPGSLGGSTLPVANRLESATYFNMNFAGPDGNAQTLKLIRTSSGTLIGAWTDMSPQREIVIKLIAVAPSGAVTPLPDLAFPQSTSLLAANNEDVTAFDLIEVPTGLAARNSRVQIGVGSKYHYQVYSAVLDVSENSYEVVQKTDALIDKAGSKFNVFGSSLSMNETKQILFAYHPEHSGMLMLQSWRFGIRLFELSPTLTARELNSVVVDDPSLERFAVGKRGGVRSPYRIYASFGTRACDYSRTSYNIHFGNYGETRAVTHMDNFLFRYNYCSDLSIDFSLYSNVFRHFGYVEGLHQIRDPETDRYAEDFPIRDSTFLSSWKTHVLRNPEKIKLQSRTFLAQ